MGGSGHGEGSRVKAGDQRGDAVVVQVSQRWLGAQEMERSRWFQRTTLEAESTGQMNTGLDVGVLGGGRNQDVRLV